MISTKDAAKMKVMVTGANGYIASNLVRYLLVSGYEVIALERKSSNLNKLRDLRGRIDIVKVRTDFMDIENNIRKFKPGIVVHLAALTLVEHTPEQIKPLLTSNILFPTLLLEAMLRNGVKNLVSAGSFWEYIKCRGKFVPYNLYAATKSAFERILGYYEYAHDFHAVTLKLYGVYGPFDPRNKIFKYFKQSIDSKEPVPFSPGKQKLDLIYIDDAVRAFEKAIRYVVFRKKNSAHESFFIGLGKSTELRQIAVAFERCVGRPLRIKWGGRSYRQGEIMNSFANIKSALMRLKWKPRYDLKRGISQMLATEGASK